MPFTLRMNAGSFRPIIRVYAYDPWSGTALVKTQCKFDDSIAIEMVAERDLQAISDDENLGYGDVTSMLREMAEELVNDDIFATEGKFRT